MFRVCILKPTRVAPEVKFLGVVIDDRLSWEPQMKQRKQKRKTFFEKNRRSELNGLFDNFNQIINIFFLKQYRSYSCD